MVLGTTLKMTVLVSDTVKQIADALTCSMRMVLMTKSFYFKEKYLGG